MPVNRSRLTRMRLLGLAVLAAVGLVVALGYTRPNPFADRFAVRAVFDDWAGTGALPTEVRIAGVRVGEVADARRMGDDAVVKMELDRDAGSVYRDARAELRPRTAFEGTAFIELHPGDQGSGRLGEAPIPKSRTRNYVALDQALRVARPDTRDDIRADVRLLGEALDPGARSGVQQLLRRAPHLTRDLAAGARAARGPHGEELAGVVEGFADTMAAVQREEANLVPLLRGTERTLAALNVDAGAPLGRTIEELPARLSGIERGSRALRSVLDELDPLAVDLRPALLELAPALAETRRLLAEARPVLRSAPPLLRDLRVALDAGGDATPAARSLLAETDPVVDLLNRSLLPTLLEPSELGMPTYRQFLVLFQGGAGAFRSFQSDETSDPFCRGAALLVPGCERLGTGHYARFGAIFDIAREPVVPCDPEKQRCSPVQDEEARR